eukprot:2353567-Pleurochrysis_carterae.AAC.1
MRLRSQQLGCRLPGSGPRRHLHPSHRYFSLRMLLSTQVLKPAAASVWQCAAHPPLIPRERQSGTFAFCKQSSRMGRKAWQ